MIVRQIQRVLRSRGVGRGRDEESDFGVIQKTIIDELTGPGSLFGYRMMWFHLKNKYHLSVKRDTVMMMLANLDPEGTAERKARKLKRRIYRSKGPNFAWHCDGYHKLKPFGITIHGCIDGYSRHVLWLEVANSNNNPRFVAKYYVDSVRKLRGCPRILRSDKGTENAHVAIMQPMLRHYHLDVLAKDKSHRYGRSVSNQKIEAFWGQLRKSFSEWWISFFKDLEMIGDFCSGLDYHIDAIRYSFGPLIRNQLNMFRNEWNGHNIRHSSMTELPSGVPNVLYNFPYLKGVEDYLCPVDSTVLNYLEQEYCTTPTLVGTEFRELAAAICHHYCLQEIPLTFGQSVETYYTIVNVIEKHM